MGTFFLSLSLLAIASLFAHNTVTNFRAYPSGTPHGSPCQVECRDSDVQHVDSDDQHDAGKDTGKRLFLCAQ